MEGVAPAAAEGGPADDGAMVLLAPATSMAAWPAWSRASAKATTSGGLMAESLGIDGRTDGRKATETARRLVSAFLSLQEKRGGTTTTTTTVRLIGRLLLLLRWGVGSWENLAGKKEGRKAGRQGFVGQRNYSAGKV